jgi:SAM-dependent methyltransferase
MGWDYGPICTEIYDLDKPIGHSFGDVEYYRDRLAGIDGPVLEPAVGTGRILIPLLRAGFEVTGLDISPDMLALCRKHCQDYGLSPELHQADLTEFVRPGAYAAVIMPAGSIALLDGAAATSRALTNFHDSLRPGGRLLVDVPAPDLVGGPEPMRYWRSGDHIWTLQNLHIEYDRAANQTTRWTRYDKWHDGALVASELQPFRLQHWSVEEFRHLLLDAGFTDIVVTADYGDAAPGAESNDWTFAARRA